jgi:hypothetical protein
MRPKVKQKLQGTASDGRSRRLSYDIGYDNRDERSVDRRVRVFCAKPKLAEQDLHIQGNFLRSTYFGNRKLLITARQKPVGGATNDR